MQSFLKFLALAFAAAAVVDAQAQPGCTVSGAADDTLCCANMGAYTLLAMTNTANAAGPCPATMQDTIDEIYLNCDGGSDSEGNDWDTVKADVKTGAESYGCGGAAQAMPALVVAAAAAVNHLLN